MSYLGLNTNWNLFYSLNLDVKNVKGIFKIWKLWKNFPTMHFSLQLIHLHCALHDVCSGLKTTNVLCLLKHWNVTISPLIKWCCSHKALFFSCFLSNWTHFYNSAFGEPYLKCNYKIEFIWSTHKAIRSRITHSWAGFAQLQEHSQRVIRSPVTYGVE